MVIIPSTAKQAREAQTKKTLRGGINIFELRRITTGYRPRYRPLGDFYSTRPDPGMN
jgi:hypothetical protein